MWDFDYVSINVATMLCFVSSKHGNSFILPHMLSQSAFTIGLCPYSPFQFASTLYIVVIDNLKPNIEKISLTLLAFILTHLYQPQSQHIHIYGSHILARICTMKWLSFSLMILSSHSMRSLPLLLHDVNHPFIIRY